MKKTLSPPSKESLLISPYAPPDKQPDASPRLTHLDAEGAAQMVDVGDKAITSRRAVACARITMQPETLALLIDAKLPKGDALQVARIAGIMAAKRTADLIPLCHPLALTKINLQIEALSEQSIQITAEIRNQGQTGVEMEALTACSVAALTLYDMAKAVDPAMIIHEIRLVEKSGGKKGNWKHPTHPHIIPSPTAPPPKPQKQKETLEEKQQKNLALGKPRNAGLPWTETLKKELSSLFQHGESIENLTQHFERTRGSILSELARQGLIDPEEKEKHLPSAEISSNPVDTEEG